MATKKQMVEAVKAHAIEHYEEGWDVVVETYTDEEIAAVLAPDKEAGVRGVSTRYTAIKRFKETVVAGWVEKREEALA